MTDRQDHGTGEPQSEEKAATVTATQSEGRDRRRRGATSYGVTVKRWFQLLTQC